MTDPLKYVEFVEYRSQRNPCLKPVVDLLKNVQKSTKIRTKPNFVWIDYTQNHLNRPNHTKTTLEAVVRDIHQVKQSVNSPPSPDFRRILIVEDIDVDSIIKLGSNLDLDPVFFAHYLLTDFGDIEKAPAPASSSLLPSSLIERDSIHMHYQQIIDIAVQNHASSKVYKYKTPGNVRRAVRCLPSLSGGVQPAIMRGCCSTILKQFNAGSWLCLVLIDSSSDVLFPQRKPTDKDITPSPHNFIPFQGGFEDFKRPETFTDFTTRPKQSQPSKTSFLHNLIWYYQTSPPGLDLERPVLLSLAYYPIKIIFSHWMLYVLVVSRYYKYYEYSVNKTHLNSALENTLVELQRWRRRARQSLHKVTTVARFIDQYSRPDIRTIAPLSQEALAINDDLSQVCESLRNDYRHIIAQIEDYNQGMEFLISISTTMVQLSNGRQSVLEAVNVRRFTYIVLIFAPLGLVATVFSMSGEFLPGSPKFWIYAVTALLTLVIVLIVVITTDSSMQARIQEWFGPKEARGGKA